MMVLSHYQVEPLLKAREAEQESAVTSLDLNRTQTEVRLDERGVTFPDGQRISWAEAEEIRENESTCYLVRDSAIERVQFYSEHTDRFYSLLATTGAPTMLIAGFPMHRIKGIDPHEDTRRKIETVKPVVGRVLDTTTGLGYTAIQAARFADHVTTIEIDPTSIEVARRNPWSQELFDNPKIEQVIGDSFEVVPTLPDAAFSRIFHDPPTFKLAGQLYSGDFYRELYRVLKSGGRIFHYIGDLNSAHGNTVGRGAVRRLQESGFAKVVRRPEAFGVVAYK
ncbi:MAG: methyltransferase domain-containing protein [Armatimonadetes bacterium]|nr:methyltransferase domain-containing protein [Armatimonadota bacterium]